MRRHFNRAESRFSEINEERSVFCESRPDRPCSGLLQRFPRNGKSAANAHLSFFFMLHRYVPEMDREATFTVGAPVPCTVKVRSDPMASISFSTVNRLPETTISVTGFPI